MSKVEEEISAMLPVQQEVIAKASLAGVTFTRHETQRKIIHDGDHRRSWVPFVIYECYLPDGRMVNPGVDTGFEDIYSAACAAVAIMERPPDPAPDGSFVLYPENEEVRCVRSFSLPKYFERWPK